MKVALKRKRYLDPRQVFTITVIAGPADRIGPHDSSALALPPHLNPHFSDRLYRPTEVSGGYAARRCRSPSPS